MVMIKLSSWEFCMVISFEKIIYRCYLWNKLKHFVHFFFFSFYQVCKVADQTKPVQIQNNNFRIVCNILKLTIGCQNQHFTSLSGCKYPFQVLHKPIRIIFTCQTMTTRKEMNLNIAHLYDKPVIQTSGSFFLDKNNGKQEAHGPRFAHLSDIATAGMQMFPIIYAKIQP